MSAATFLHPPLICPQHCALLQSNSSGATLRCSEGCEYPVINGIPRFVPKENYADSFGIQWNAFRSTQLDSVSKLGLSKDRITRIAGGSLDWLNGKQVLEAGCGAGRFTEILLETGASLTSCDLSSAVDANRANFQSKQNHRLIQADIGQLPFGQQTFDVVICIGVLQHTPSTENSLAKLVGHLRAGGTLMVDHYALDYPETMSRRILRWFVLKRSAESRLGIVSRIVNAFWPIHKLVCHLTRGGQPNRNPLQRMASYLFTRVSPVVDHQYRYPGLSPELQREWAILDTHDTLTDVFKHKRSAEQLRAAVTALGIVDINIWLDGNGIELRGRLRQTA